MTHFDTLVMGLADCINYVGIVKTLEKSFKRKLGPLQDTLQADACIFPSFRSLPSLGMGCALIILFQVRSLNVPIIDRQVISYGAISGSP